MTIHSPGSRSRSIQARRWQLITIACAAAAVAAFTAALVSPANAAVIDQATWQVSNNQTAITGVSYTYQATVVSAAVIGSVTIALPGTPSLPPTLGPIFGIGAGTLTTASNMLVYTVKKPVIVPAGTILYLQFSGITNTTRQGWFSSVLTTMSAGVRPDIVDAGETSTVSFLSQNNAPDFTVLRSLTVAASGPSLTISSPLQGYALHADSPVLSSVEISTESESGVRTSSNELGSSPTTDPRASDVAPVVWALTGTATRSDVVTLGFAPPTGNASGSSSAAVHLTVGPAY